MLLSLLNWVGNNQQGYLFMLYVPFYVNFDCKTTYDMLIGTWRTTQENSTTTRTKRALVLAE
jgi:hypothetical protein